MKDMQAQLEKLRTDAAECALIRDLATDPKKRELFIRLADHLSVLAAEVERAIRDECEEQRMTGGGGGQIEEPIKVDGPAIVPLRNAGEYVATLPKEEHAAPEWQAAMQALILVAELGGPTLFARIGIMLALNTSHRSTRRAKSRIGHGGS